MSVRRFLGANNRDALRQVREALGADAMILSSRQVADGYEIMAMAEEALEEKVAAVEQAPPQDFSALAERLLGEVQQMRAMLSQQQVAGDTPRHVVRELVNILQAAGFSSELIRELVAVFSALPSATANKVTDVSAWLSEQLQHRLHTPSVPAELFAAGVVALIGPTGVGKTTTTAKLAAHYVMQFGPEPLLLVTTDGYRVGAREQLRIYAELLGVEMYALEEGEGFEQLQQRMHNKKLVLIDTVGMSQRDQRLTQRIAELQRKQVQQHSGLAAQSLQTRLVLLLNAGSQRETLDEVVQLFQGYAANAGNHVRDCILTKVDESVRLGGALDVLLRQGLTLHFISNGQRVPEDLELPDGSALVEQALAGVAAEYAEFSQWLQSVTATEQAPARVHTSKLQAQGKTIASLLQQLELSLPGFSQFHELRELAELPTVEQAEALPELQQHNMGVLAELAPSSLHWPRPKPVAGVKWHLPMFTSQNAGELLPLPLSSGPLSVEESERFATMPVQQHIFAALPDSSTLAVLAAGEQAWLAVVNRNHRLYTLAGKREAALNIQKSLRKYSETPMLYRGESAQLLLQQGSVRLSAEGITYVLWHGEVNSSQRTANLVRRFWLLPSYVSAEQAVALIREQLAADEHASLSRQAFHLLQQAEYANLPLATLVAMASSLAACAIYLEQSERAPLASARQRILSLPGQRGKANARKILAGLHHLMEASAAMQIMSAAGVRSE